jgi:formate hydrogenlyase transcriptional activator
MMLSDCGTDRFPSPVFAPRACNPLDVLRGAFERSPNGVVVAGDNGTIVFVNGLASAIFHYPLGALVGQPLSQLLPGTVPAAHDAQWTRFWNEPHRAAAISGRTVDGLRHDGVTVPLEISLSLLAEGTTRYMIVSIVDITERLNLEARLAAATHAHLGFQRLIADVAAGFGTIDPAAVDDAIVDALRHVGEVLQLDWAMLWQWHSGEATARPVHHYWTQPSSHSPPEPLPIASMPFVIASLTAGESCCFATVDDLPDSDRDVFRRHGLRSGTLVPLAATGDDETVLSALALGSMTREREWPPAIIEGLRLIAGVMSQALARQAGHNALQEALDEIRRLRDRVALDNVNRRRETKVPRASSSMISESAAIQRLLAQIEQVAPTPATVLLLGETGTGKEMLAQTVHDLSPRHQRPMIRVSCAAIPTSLIESELFGREKGAYTGALSRQIGRFEAANQSTLFLDEIGDLPMEVQVKLLRVLQERVIERLGSTQPIKVDVRIIAATNRNLEDAVRDKTFREDLFYRLNVFPVVVPPLRERVEDIPALVWSFIDEFSRLFGKTVETISKESLRELQRYSWPGNVRELRNVIERATIMATGPHLVVEAPRLGERPVPQTAMTLSEVEVEHIRAVLNSTGWRVRGSGGAAERLGVKPTTLESRMARLGIERQRAS